MTSKAIIFTAIAIGVFAVSANAQKSNSTTMSKPRMKTTTDQTAMPPKSDSMTDKKSDAMEDKKMSRSTRHHHHRMHHHHHRMMHHKM